MVDKTLLRDEIIELISDITENDIKDVKKETVKTNFIQGVDVDSLMALEIISGLEKKYGVEIKEEELPKLGSIDDIIDLMSDLIASKNSSQKMKEKAVPAKKNVSKRSKKIRRRFPPSKKRISPNKKRK